MEIGARSIPDWEAFPNPSEPWCKLLSHQLFCIPFPEIFKGLALCVLLANGRNKAYRPPGCLKVTPGGAET
jgi:hypothetical protein